MSGSIKLSQICVQSIMQECPATDPDNIGKKVAQLANKALDGIDKNSTSQDIGKSDGEKLLNAKSCRDCYIYSKYILGILNEDEKELNSSD